MELETMFSEQRWNIIRCLGENKHSPLQLAGKLNTTIANISQQLRLLQAANLVKTERVQSREKGKPRKFFTLSHDYVYLISAMNEFTDKKLLELSDHHKTILKIWFMENSELHYDLEKFYWKIEKYLKDITGIIVLPQMGKADIIVVSDKNIEKYVQACVNKISTDNVLTPKVYSRKEITQLMQQKRGPFKSELSPYVLYDADGSLTSIGGDTA